MWCGRRRVTRVAGSRLQPYRMETCDTEEPDEGNLHVRICGGLGRAIAESTWTRKAALASTPVANPWAACVIAIVQRGRGVSGNASSKH